MTASMLFPSFSSILRKSLYCLAFSYLRYAGAALTSFTSHSATMFSVRETPPRIAGPLVPTPIPATFNFEL
jgi:hypothetical protein